jgi:hypothetical protein
MQRNIAGYFILFSVDYSVEIVSVDMITRLEKTPEELKNKKRINR